MLVVLKLLEISCQHCFVCRVDFRQENVAQQVNHADQVCEEEEKVALVIGICGEPHIGVVVGCEEDPHPCRRDGKPVKAIAVTSLCSAHKKYHGHASEEGNTEEQGHDDVKEVRHSSNHLPGRDSQ